MSIFKKIAGVVGSVFPPAKLVGEVVSLIAGETGKSEEEVMAQYGPDIQAKLLDRDMQRDAMMEQTLQTELQTRAQIIQAEMDQGDKFTKRARPTIVYSGLAMFFLEFVIRAYSFLADMALPSGTLVPEPIIIGWTTVIGIYGAGRTWEKVSARKSGNGESNGNGLLGRLLGA